jgi:SAM-dependent methyltransferase
MKGAGGFFFGKSLPDEIEDAMKRVGAYGITYPEGYDSVLKEKYSRQGVSYPHILMILGKPRINHHFFYSRACRRAGRLLDYGCGTGDNVRQLIRDGFPQEQITAFDINGESIGLGFDLYRDRENIQDLFVVSKKFPFGQEEFDTVYSASVIHVIADEKEFLDYLSNAYFALSPDGVLFGSTLGLREGAVRSPGTRGPPRIMTKKELAGFLTGTGFDCPEIVQWDGVPGYIPESENLCFFEFYTKKHEPCEDSSR